MAKRATTTPTQSTVHDMLGRIQLARELILLTITIGAVVGPAIGLATGAISLSGIGILGSPFFWSVYSGGLIMIVTGFINWLILRWLRTRLRARGWTLSKHRAPDAYLGLCHVPWFLFFVPYLFAIGHLAGQAEYAGPAIGVGIVGIVGLFFGGLILAEMASNVDRLMNPWDYHEEWLDASDLAKAGRS